MVYQAKQCDATAVAKLAAKMWTSTAEAVLKDEFEELVLNSDNGIFLCVEDGVPIGFAQCQLRRDYVEGTKTSPVAYLEGIFVEENYRKQGYGKLLVRTCEKWAKSRGCSEFASDCELQNTDSLDFHLHTGFQEVNRIICFTKKL